jgi:hypothetical protein
MTLLDRYLREHFLDFDRLAASNALSPQQLRELLNDRLIPAASYIVASNSVTSYVFGTLPATTAAPGEYFHPATHAWIARAAQVVARVGRSRAYAALQTRFTANMERALADLNASVWRLRDAFAEDGAMLEGLPARIDSMWDHFLHGTFGLCVANPVSELEIARKEVLQEKLTALSAEGSLQASSETEAHALHGLIDAYAAAAMPFSPIEFGLSSRKRLVDNLKARLTGITALPATVAEPAIPHACGWS